jgi:preprotein translocase subunit YajC
MLAPSSSLLLAEAAAPSLFSSMAPIILMVAVFYFLVIRPQRNVEKERQLRLSKLDKGDQVRLSGGILGRVSSVEDQIVMVEIADKVRIKVLRAEIADKWEPPAVTGTVVNAATATTAANKDGTEARG